MMRPLRPEGPGPEPPAAAATPKERIGAAIEELDRARAQVYAPGDAYDPALSALMEILDEAKRQASDVLSKVRE